MEQPWGLSPYAMGPEEWIANELERRMDALSVAHYPCPMVRANALAKAAVTAWLRYLGEVAAEQVDPESLDMETMQVAKLFFDECGKELIHVLTCLYKNESQDASVS